jgi:Thioesterase-like superfamily
MRAFEQLPAPDGLSLARVTYEFIRPAPIGSVEIRSEVTRPGRRTQLLEGSMVADGVEVVRARALRVLRAQTGGAGAEHAGGSAGCDGADDTSSRDAGAGVGAVDAQVSAPPAGPEHGRPSEFDLPHQPMFAPDSVEIRFVVGTWGRGPCTAWFRLRRPLVTGETPSPLQHLAAAGDFGNGISATLSWDDYLFINPDLTLYIEREPVGEWICLDSRTRINAGGIGIAESVLFDEHGRVGQATQALLVAPR